MKLQSPTDFGGSDARSGTHDRTDTLGQKPLRDVVTEIQTKVKSVGVRPSGGTSRGKT